MNKYIFIVVFIGFQVLLYGQKRIDGVILPLPVGEYFIQELISSYTCLSAPSGKFELYIPDFQDNIDLIINDGGVIIARLQQKLGDNKSITVDLSAHQINFDEVIIISDRISKSRVSAQLDVASLHNMPSLIGETDVLKNIQRLRGVKFGSEGSSDFVVRGGNVGENQILLDGMPTYVSGHLFGLLSHLQSDPISKINFYSSGFPANYSGKLSSIVDLQTKALDQSKDTLMVNLGLVASSAYAEKRISNKVGVLIGARTSPLPLYHKVISNIDDAPAYTSFFDFTGKIEARINSKQSFFLNGLISQDWIEDPFSSDKKSRFVQTIVKTPFFGATHKYLSRNVKFETKYSTSSFGSNYTTFDNNNNIESSYNYFHGAKQSMLKSHMTYFFNNDISLDAGLNYEREQFSYNSENSINNNNFISKDTLNLSNEIARSFVNLEYFKRGFLINAGAVYTLSFINYQGYLEPRFKISYTLKPLELYASFTRMHQFNALISNRSLGNYIKIWLPVTFSSPLRSDDFTIGLKNNGHSKFAFGAEVYKKKRRNLLHLQEGSRILITNKEVGKVLFNGEGNSFGIESWFSMKFDQISIGSNVTLSRSFLHFDEINGGNSFPDYNDRLIASNIDINYDLSPKWRLNAAFTYYSGNPYTFSYGSFPDYGGYDKYKLIFAGNSTSSFIYPKGLNFAITELNNRRLPAHHRLDLSVQKTGRLYKKYNTSLNLGLYNVYLRRNPLYVKLESIYDPYDVSKGLDGVKYSFASYFIFIPSLNYSIQF